MVAIARASFGHGHPDRSSRRVTSAISSCDSVRPPHPPAHIAVERAPPSAKGIATSSGMNVAFS